MNECQTGACVYNVSGSVFMPESWNPLRLNIWVCHLNHHPCLVLLPHFDQSFLPHPSLVLSSIFPYYFFSFLISPVAMETSLPAFSKWVRPRADAFMTIWAFISLVRLWCYWKFVKGIKCFHIQLKRIFHKTWADEKKSCLKRSVCWSLSVLHSRSLSSICPQVNHQGQVAFPRC